MERTRGNVWAVVLAAGDGARMARLTSMVYGKAVPKQFAALDGERSFVQKTLDRLAGFVPASRIVVVIGDAHEDYATAQLKAFKGITLLKQPVDLGTAPGVLFPLCHILARDPHARVLILPSDQNVQDVGGFMQALRRGLRAAEATPTGVAVLGAPPERAGTDLPWLMPNLNARSRRSGVQGIRRIFDRAPADLEPLLESKGGLWSTNIVAGSAAALWQLFEEHLPSQTANFRRYLSHVGFPQERRVLEDVYWETLPADFFREVIAPAVGLSVVSIGNVGWDDCGTPERFLGSVRGTPAFQALLGRLMGHHDAFRPTAPRPVPAVVGAA